MIVYDIVGFGSFLGGYKTENWVADPRTSGQVYGECRDERGGGLGFSFGGMKNGSLKAAIRFFGITSTLDYNRLFL